MIARAVHRNGTRYGCGAITDGVFKITVNTLEYEANEIQLGERIEVIGRVNLNGKLIFLNTKNAFLFFLRLILAEIFLFVYLNLFLNLIGLLAITCDSMANIRVLEEAPMDINLLRRGNRNPRRVRNQAEVEQRNQRPAVEVRNAQHNMGNEVPEQRIVQVAVNQEAVNGVNGAPIERPPAEGILPLPPVVPALAADAVQEPAIVPALAPAEDPAANLEQANVPSPQNE